MSDQSSDTDLWAEVVGGSAQAFEQVVSRYQGVVSAIAYSRLGSLEASQDVAQETFWVAWTSRTQLRDATRLAAWLCGIARNLSHRQAGTLPSTSSLDSQTCEWDRASNHDPLEQSIAAERAHILWQAVHELPEHYRDVMVLFYRQEQSISHVAAALELSEDAVKQRLSRARAMLREELAGVVEDTLVRSRPGKAFTAKVMSGLVAMGVVSQATSASAATATVATSGAAAGSALLGKAASASALGSMAGGLLGTIGGLAGAWLGVYLPSEMAPTETERQLMRKRGRTLMIVSLAFILLIFVAIAIGYWAKSTALYVALLLMLQAVFTITVVMLTLRMRREIAEIRKRVKPQDDPNQSAWRRRQTDDQGKFRALKYTSSLSFLGWPLLDIQFADPTTDGSMPARKIAKGWIAIGDGAIGCVACGGISCGVFSFGGLALGAFAMGGGAVGMLSVGGLAIGGIALGGGAIALWQAAGGAALALHTAFGGAAVAWHLAGGGFAIAVDMAAGGGGSAAEFNSAAAKAAIDALWIKNILEVSVKSQLFFPIVFGVSILPAMLNRFIYRKVP